MRRVFCVVASALLLASCGKKADQAPAASTAAAPSQRKIDTAIAKSGLPGASAVGRAMGAADRTTAQQDSMANQLR